MFKTIEKSYAYYLSECEKYKAYKKRWKWLLDRHEHYRWKEVTENKIEWRIKLYAIEKALNLSDKEKIKF